MEGVIAVAESVSGLINRKYAAHMVGAVSFVPPYRYPHRKRGHTQNLPINFTYSWRFDYGGLTGNPSMEQWRFNWKLFLTFMDGFVKVQVSHWMANCRELCDARTRLEYADPCFLDRLDGILDQQVGVSEGFQREMQSQKLVGYGYPLVVT